MPATNAVAMMPQGPGFTAKQTLTNAGDRMRGWGRSAAANAKETYDTYPLPVNQLELSRNIGRVGRGARPSAVAPRTYATPLRRVLGQIYAQRPAMQNPLPSGPMFTLGQTLGNAANAVMPGNPITKQQSAVPLTGGFRFKTIAKGLLNRVLGTHKRVLGQPGLPLSASGREPAPESPLIRPTRLPRPQLPRLAMEGAQAATRRGERPSSLVSELERSGMKPSVVDPYRDFLSSSYVQRPTM